MEIILLSSLLVILLLLNALFNIAEVALIGSNRARIKKLAEEGKRSAKIILKLIEKPSEYLSVLIVGITLVVTCGTAIVTYLTTKVFSPKLIPLFIFIWTVIIVLFGEIIPKAVTVTKVDFFALKVARITNLFITLLSPIVRLLIMFADFIVKPIKLAVKEEKVTEDEIKILVKEGVEDGTIEEEERKMIHGVFKFADKLAMDIMVPRVDIKALDKNKSIYDAIELLTKYGYSQIPLYEESIDKIVGIIHIKDLIKCVKSEKVPSLDEIKREAYFVPETKRIIELFKEMRENKRSLAIVIDEYGGCAGLVTFEDLLEEIVGEIQDEYDKEEEPYIKKLAENIYLIDAKLNIDDANELLDLNLPPKENVNTMGGFIFTYLGRVPKEGEVFPFNNIEFIIDKVEKQRIKKIKIKKLNDKSATQ